MGGELRVGCAMWANRVWVGSCFPRATRPGEELEQYVSWCTTVEGNTTFYSLPAPATLAKWVDATPETFRFCFKLPRTITHERRLRNVEVELAEFLTLIEPLGSRIGPVQIQLPATFEPGDVDVLAAFLRSTPQSLDWAVEVRHEDFFAGGPAEAPLDDLLASRGVNRVMLDSRALFAARPITPEEHDAWEKKPRLPVRPVATADQPLVRIIGQSDGVATREFWQSWVPVVARWLAEGHRPHVFVHTPDNAIAPHLAREFWADVAAVHSDLTPLPEPIIDSEQLDLF